MAKQTLENILWAEMTDPPPSHSNDWYQGWEAGLRMAIKQMRRREMKYTNMAIRAMRGRVELFIIPKEEINDGD